jgi:phosphatidylglycerophosphate synthase
MIVQIEAHADEFVDAPRVHQAITAGAEKRLLVWIARRMPAFVTPDRLTALGLGAQLCAGAAYALASYDRRALWLVTVFLLFNWLGDSLDGTLARVRNQQRLRYGFYVDHVCDTIGVLALMAGLGCSGYLHWPIAAGMLLGFYALSIESYLATYTLGRFHLSHGWFGPTDLRILLAAGNAAAYWKPYTEIAGRHLLLFDFGGAIGIVGMAIMFLATAARHTAALYREETL